MRRLSLRLARTKDAPAEAERACCDRDTETEDRAVLKSVWSDGWQPSRFSMASIPDINQRDEDIISS